MEVVYKSAKCSCYNYLSSFNTKHYMNQKFSGYIPFLILLLLAGDVAYSQNVPNTETQPAGSATIFTAPPDLPSEGVGFNYTRSYAPMVPITNSDDVTEASSGSDVKISTTYRDGFNRGMQTIIRNVSNNVKKHVVIPVDTRVQRDGYSYLPYATEFDNSINHDPIAFYRPEPFDEQKSYYNDLYPGEGYTSFSMSKYFSDAGQRAMVSYAPGKSQVGQNRGTTTKVIANDAGVVRIWTINSSGLPQSSGFYAADLLFGQLIINTDGVQVTTFADKDGHDIYQKQYLNVTTLPGNPPTATQVFGITYNVYDDLGQLRYTIPPAATALISGGTLTQAQIDNLCYQYSYDAKGQLVRRKLPGKAQELFVYDKMGRVVLFQDGNLSSYKWNFSIYDVKGRSLCTGIYENTAASRQVLQGYFFDANNYAAPSLFYYQKNYKLYQQYPSTITGAEILTYNYYDNYNNADPTGSLWATYDNDLQFTPDLLSTPGAETPNKSNLVQGMATGSRVKILPAPDADVSQTGQWRETVNFYDDKGRSIYIVSRDLYNNNPIHVHYAGTQYDFAGRNLISKHVSFNTNSTDGVRKELIRNYYDVLTGALTQTQHKVDNNNWNVLALYTYDEMGRVKRKVLGNYGEVRDFSYNIRGQLEGINPVYAMTGNKEGESRTFGESLKYDFGFTAPRYDGKVAGMIWRGSTAANNNAYGYSYDQAGRLITADYRKWEPASAPYLFPAWRNDKTDYSVSNLQYDLNGNILSMKQRGMGLVNGVSTPVDIDRLRYDYEIQSNRLLRVYDTTTVDYGTGDFQNTNGTANDYVHNANGSLQSDNNKGIRGVTYNHLNKPVTIAMVTNGTISYSYDAAGNKVQEHSTVNGVNGVTKVTDYVGNFVYEDNVAKYAVTGEGRTAFDITTAQPIKEEFFVKDHLENVRSVVDVYNWPMTQYLATFELASANLEGLFFGDMEDVRDLKPGSTDPNDNRAGNLNGADPDRRIGTSMLLHVMAGDKVELKVNNYYDGYDAGDDQPVYMEDMLGSVISTLTGGEGGFIGSETHNTKLVNDVFGMPNYQAYDQLVSQQADAQKPKAYLNYLLFNERMELVPEMSGAFQANGNGTWAQIGTTAPMTIPANGYLAVYLSNRTVLSCVPCGNVYFDQLMVHFTTGKLKEEAHYYPYGLPISTMGSAAVGFIANKHKYQSNEYSKEQGLNWMDFHNRQYDPQIGRFLSIDPLAAATATMSPYTGMNNDPVNVVDPLGLQGYNYLAQMPNMNNVSPVPMALVDYGAEKNAAKDLINNTPANAPGGVAGWFMDVSTSLRNDAMGAAQAQGDGGSVDGEGIEASAGAQDGFTRDQVQDAGWIIDGEDDGRFYAHRFTQEGDITTLAREGGQFLKPGDNGGSISSGDLNQSNFNWTHWIAPGVGLFTWPIIPKKFVGANMSGATTLLSKGLAKINIPTKLIGKTRMYTHVVNGSKRYTTNLGRYAGRWGSKILGSAAFWWTAMDVAYSAADYVKGLFPDDESSGNMADAGVCFREGTLVYSKDSFINIEDLHVGDSIYSYNINSSKIEIAQIEKVYRRLVMVIGELKIGNEIIWVTKEHPFFVKKKGWVKSKDLKKGDKVMTSSGTKEVKSYLLHNKKMTVYNIEVSGNHNYFVTPIMLLVHNKYISEEIDKKNDNCKNLKKELYNYNED
jgi:RHS repeat-associated protein